MYSRYPARNRSQSSGFFGSNSPGQALTPHPQMGLEQDRETARAGVPDGRRHAFGRLPPELTLAIERDHGIGGIEEGVGDHGDPIGTGRGGRIEAVGRHLSSGRRERDAANLLVWSDQRGGRQRLGHGLAHRPGRLGSIGSRARRVRTGTRSATAREQHGRPEAGPHHGPTPEHPSPTTVHTHLYQLALRHQFAQWHYPISYYVGRLHRGSRLPAPVRRLVPQRSRPGSRGLEPDGVPRLS